MWLHVCDSQTGDPFMKINSQIYISPNKLPDAAQDVVKNEPMLLQSTREFAKQHGGPLTHHFLNALPWEDVIIDSRVHMLMPGMYPCVPGWHHDDVPRERADGQPNYENPSYKSAHCLALWGDCSLTEFATGIHEFDIPPVGKKIYKELSPIVESLCQDGTLNRIIAPERSLVFFDWMSWHRGAETTKSGFRFFIRATRNSKLIARNEIRQNANVYMPVLDEGW